MVNIFPIYEVGRLIACIEDKVTRKKNSMKIVHIWYLVSDWLLIHLFWKGIVQILSHPNSSKTQNRILLFRPNFIIFLFCFLVRFSAYYGFVISLVFKFNICSLRNNFWFNIIAENFSQFCGGFENQFNRFITCNLSDFYSRFKVCWTLLPSASIYLSQEKTNSYISFV